MVEIHSAQALVDALLDAGDRLAIIDFYSPGCGGCKALHPKVLPCCLLSFCSSSRNLLCIRNQFWTWILGCCWLNPFLYQICQLAELNPDAIFLKVNFEDLKTMCQALHIRVLPFFRFYRGGEGRVCSFSCTNSTVRTMSRFSSFPLLKQRKESP